MSVASGGNFKERMIILSRTVFVWNWKYLCLVWPTVYTYEVKTISKNAFFSNILLRVDWKRMLIVFVWTDGKWGLRIRWCHTSYSAFSERDAIVIPSFKLFRVDRWKRFKHSTSGRVFPRKQRKKISFFWKYPVLHFEITTKTNNLKLCFWQRV